MAKPQFVATNVVLGGSGSLMHTDSYADSVPIEDARPSPRRALSVAVCQHRSVRRRHIAGFDRRCGSGDLGDAECTDSVRAGGAVPRRRGGIRPWHHRGAWRWPHGRGVRRLAALPSRREVGGGVCGRLPCHHRLPHRRRWNHGRARPCPCHRGELSSHQDSSRRILPRRGGHGLRHRERCARRGFSFGRACADAARSCQPRRSGCPLRKTIDTLHACDQ